MGYNDIHDKVDARLDWARWRIVVIAIASLGCVMNDLYHEGS